MFSQHPSTSQSNNNELLGRLHRNKQQLEKTIEGLSERLFSISEQLSSANRRILLLESEKVLEHNGCYINSKLCP